MSYSNNKYSEISIHPHAHEMLYRLSCETYIHMNQLVGMYIANEACLLDSIGPQAYVKQCETRFDEAEETLEYFKPSDSKKYTGKIKIYKKYLAKLREIAWSINVRPKDFLNYVISAEYKSFVNLTKESNEAGIGRYIGLLGVYRALMDALFDPPTTSIYKTRKQVSLWEHMLMMEIKRQQNTRNTGGNSGEQNTRNTGGNSGEQNTRNTGGNSGEQNTRNTCGNSVYGEYTWREAGFIPAIKLKSQGGDSFI